MLTRFVIQFEPLNTTLARCFCETFFVKLWVRILYIFPCQLGFEKQNCMCSPHSRESDSSALGDFFSSLVGSYLQMYPIHNAVILNLILLREACHAFFLQCCRRKLEAQERDSAIAMSIWQNCGPEVNSNFARLYTYFDCFQFTAGKNIFFQVKSNVWYCYRL